MTIGTLGLSMILLCLLGFYLTRNKPWYIESRMPDGSMGNDWTIKPYLLVILLMGFALLFSVARYQML